MKISLTRGKLATVDDNAPSEIISKKWCYSVNGYAVRNNGAAVVYMHREILGLRKGDGIEVDHINRNKLDNRQCNLRCYTGHTENQQNVPKCTRREFTSRYKGVFWNSIHRKWQASIHKERKKYYLGRFNDESVAALAYDCAATTLYGENAYLNFSGDERRKL